MPSSSVSVALAALANRSVAVHAAIGAAAAGGGVATARLQAAEALASELDQQLARHQQMLAAAEAKRAAAFAAAQAHPSSSINAPAGDPSRLLAAITEAKQALALRFGISTAGGMARVDQVVGVFVAGDGTALDPAPIAAASLVVAAREAELVPLQASFAGEYAKLIALGDWLGNLPQNAREQVEALRRRIATVVDRARSGTLAEALDGFGALALIQRERTGMMASADPTSRAISLGATTATALTDAWNTQFDDHVVPALIALIDKLTELSTARSVLLDALHARDLHLATRLGTGSAAVVAEIVKPAVGGHVP